MHEIFEPISKPLYHYGVLQNVTLKPWEWGMWNGSSVTFDYKACLLVMLFTLI